jgi:hypothetical protein
MRGFKHKYPSPPKQATQTIDEAPASEKSEDDSPQGAVWQYLLGALECAVIVPILFYLTFGEIGAFGWSVTAFFVVYMCLVALGLFFGSRTEYHTKVAMKGDWMDKIGAWWLMGCAFGPLFGWFFTSGTIPITQGTWHFLFGIRILLTIILPILLALPLLRYARGKAGLIALPLLILITWLPVLSGVNSALDFWHGPVTGPIGRRGEIYTYLPHTGKVLETLR